MISYFPLTCISNLSVGWGGDCFFHFFGVVRLCIRTARCVFFFLFCEAFSLWAAALSSADWQTDWLTDPLSVYEPISLSLCLCSLFSFSSLFQTLSNKSIFQNLLKEVYFSHSFLLLSALSFVFTACFNFLSMLPSRFAFCLVQFLRVLFCHLLKCD